MSTPAGRRPRQPRTTTGTGTNGARPDHVSGSAGAADPAGPAVVGAAGSAGIDEVAGTTAAPPTPAGTADAARPAPAGGPDDRTPPAPLPEDRFLNRELSWLDFNARVLALAEDPRTPLLERAKFLAIFASNLDEFFMVRIAGLKRRLQAGLPMRGGDQLPLRTQLDLIAAKTADLVARHAGCFVGDVLPKLAAAGIHIFRWTDLDA
ncbi:RNA degradosome polyphosphate kinase, partial [Micromonospora echinofusca]|nr:RNA degradosome polyphosphate kinase [Micromonospora echinofusca]